MDSDKDPTEKRLKQVFAALKADDRRRMVSFDYLVEGRRPMTARSGLRLMPWAVAVLLVAAGLGSYLMTTRDNGRPMITANSTKYESPDNLGDEDGRAPLTSPQVIALAPPEADIPADPLAWVPSSDVLMANSANVGLASDALLADAAL